MHSACNTPMILLVSSKIILIYFIELSKYPTIHVQDSLRNAHKFMQWAMGPQANNYS